MQDGEQQLWCYTTTPNVRWDYCSCTDQVPPPPPPPPTSANAGCELQWTLQLAALAIQPTDAMASVIEFERGRAGIGAVGGTYFVSLRAVGAGEQFLRSADVFHVHVHYMYVPKLPPRTQNCMYHHPRTTRLRDVRCLSAMY